MEKEIKFITGVSMSVFSIARDYGGCKVQGRDFIYYPNEDALVRKDLVKAYNKALKEGKTLEEFAASIAQ